MFKEIKGEIGNEFLSAVQNLPEFYFEGGWTNDIVLEIRRLPAAEEELCMTKEKESCQIEFREKIHLFRALGLLRQYKERKTIQIKERMRIPEIGVMIDVSRNSVPKIDFLKAVLDNMALMGLNRMILYMEDVYEMDMEPRFGYMRGGYSKRQLKSLDDYANQYGIQIVASIQVLGHMEKVLRFPEYDAVRDTASCLLVGEEKTYDLIKKMFKTIAQCFRSRLVIVGMDETNGLGEGRYRLLNGPEDPLDIFLKHLGRVYEIAQKEGMKIALYSDMIFKYASPNHTYLNPSGKLGQEVCSRIPDDVKLIYWDYYSSDPAILDGMMRKHQEVGDSIYAGPILSVSSFCVQYPATFRTARIGLKNVKKYGISMAYGCMWHDDGAECCDWLGLLGMQYYAENAYREGIVDQGILKQRFAACTGYQAEWFEDAALLDAVECVNSGNRWPPNVSKYILWEDPMEGLYDADLSGLALDRHYEKVFKLLKKDIREAGNKKWFLQVPCQLAKVLKMKADLSAGLHLHYKSGDIRALQRDWTQMRELQKEVKQLRLLHREQWMNTCSPFGWSRLDLRYGGLIARLETALCRLSDYLEGDISDLPELAAFRYLKDREGNYLGHGIWKVYSETATLSDG